MKIHILAIGTPKQKFIKDQSELYLKRVGANLSSCIEFLPDSTKVKDGEKSIELEGRTLLKNVSARDYMILLDERGSLISSEDFSLHLFSKLREVPGRILFIIGGPFGVSEEVRLRSDETISLSKMTMTHEMCLLFLSEQIYRAVMIERNSPYHHR